MSATTRSRLVHQRRSWLLRLFRLGTLVFVLLLLRDQARWLKEQRAGRITLAHARKYFPNANRIQLRDEERGLYCAIDSRGGTIGMLLKTSPQTDDVIGYSGPNNLLIALEPGGAIAGIELLASGDTPKHVELILRDAEFLRSFIGWKPAETPPKVSAVSGATLTSFAIAEGVQKRLAGASPSLRFPEPVTLADARKLFTNAAALEPDGRRWKALDATGSPLGFLIRTSPESDNVPGYRGPTESLVALARDGRTVLKVHPRQSYDTDSYVDQVRNDTNYLRHFEGRTVEALASLEFKNEKIQGLSGATLTARAVAEGLKRRLASELRVQASAARWRPRLHDWAVAAVLAGAIVMAFSSLRGKRWVRLAWQAMLIGYVGLISGDLLSLALLGGWAANGAPLKTAPGLVLLAAAAFAVPWLGRRQVYCHQLCPHGAAQQWLGVLGRRFRVSSRPRFTRVLERFPAVLLGAIVIGLLAGLPLNLASFEPFDAWVWRAAGGISIGIAVAGLALSLFVPQAYCRFGCPTGALLNFIRHPGSADHWGARDWAALALSGAAIATILAARLWPRPEPESPLITMNGRAMGTSWEVKLRDEIADQDALRKKIAEQFEWAEQMTSHWRTNTDITLFNRSDSTEPFPVPWPLVTLSRWSSEISRATDGAFDVTVGPLVRLWGFGPGAPRLAPPSDAEIEEVRANVGMEKLEILDGQLRKKHPALELDFSAIAKGWAIDQVTELIAQRGLTNFLVEAGGELRAVGAWTIAIEHPARACALTNEAIATSGTYRQNWKSGAVEYSHLIDPRTGRPVKHRTVSVSVRHKDCAHADAWATALNVLGAEQGLPLAERLGIAAQFVIERPDKKLEVRSSSLFK